MVDFGGPYSETINNMASWGEMVDLQSLYCRFLDGGGEV